MLDVLNPIWESINTHFLTGETMSMAITIGIAVVAALIAAFAMGGFGSIINSTAGALVLFGLAQMVRNVIESTETTTEDVIMDSLDGFLKLNMADFLAFFVVFFVLIAVIFIVKSSFSR